MTSQILLFIIKLVLGGIIAFLAILLMSKTRDLSWMLMVAGFLLSFAAMVFQMLIELGVLTNGNILLFGIPLPTLLCTVIPLALFISSLILMLLKKNI